ncbi:hypothetical protein V1279_001046 [Bradyrhizobium sp. AZCC 1610]|uniref:hypothetical protein n=1 Tax=Bradyrhizobium sp. AZCC 1610 TaxID=3117020 RepID=UPI002FEF646C
MPGLVPGIHVLSVSDCNVSNKKDVDGRDNPGHDDREKSSREVVIASEAKQSISLHGDSWIASSLRSSQ